MMQLDGPFAAALGLGETQQWTARCVAAELAVHECGHSEVGIRMMLARTATIGEQNVNKLDRVGRETNGSQDREEDFFFLSLFPPAATRTTNPVATRCHTKSN